MAQVIAQHLKQFTGTRLEDFRHHALGNKPRSAISNRRHFDFISLRDQSNDGVTVEPLDLFRLGDRSAESDGKVAGEVIATDRNHSSVSYRALVKYDQAGGARAQIGQANTQFALV